MPIIRLLTFALALIALQFCAQKAFGESSVEEAPKKFSVEEVSGIVRVGDELLMVGDEDAGVYYRFSLNGEKGPIIQIPTSLPGVELQEGRLALDLESIDILSDGRKVVLSERLHCLIGEEGLIVDYDNPMSEFGNRGLEGLAVRKIENGSSRVAVLWEGGYLEYDDVPKTVKKHIGRVSVQPVIWVHDLKAETGEKVIEINMKKETVEDYKIEEIVLNVHMGGGDEPQAQRFRAPDLVWHKVKKNEWGFIVLLSSESAKPKIKQKYMYTWLQRLSLDGYPVGVPFDLKTDLPNDDLKNANWEGLSWFDQGKSLILIHDSKGATTAFVLDLPVDWLKE